MEVIHSLKVITKKKEEKMEKRNLAPLEGRPPSCQTTGMKRENANRYTTSALY